MHIAYLKGVAGGTSHVDHCDTLGTLAWDLIGIIIIIMISMTVSSGSVSSMS